MSILSSNDFTIISDISKALKSDYVMFYGDKCYGVNNENNNIVKSVNINPFMNLNKIIIFNSTDIVKMGKRVKETKSGINIRDNNFLFLTCADLTISSVILPHNIINTVINNINTINMIHTYNPLLVENNLKENENFKKILELSSSDGMSLFIIDRFIMSMFNNLINVNKPDFISLGIYPFDNNTFLSRFIIDKKKFVLEINIRYMYL